MNLPKLIAWTLRKLTAELSWLSLLLFFTTYITAVWVLLWLSGEHELIQPGKYLYYTMVVISTVGFGDMSPVTPRGQLVVALFQIPFGLLIFGALIGKISQSVAIIARKGMNGKKDFSMYKDHILIFGWRGQRTKHIIDLILADKKRYNRKIILCVEKEMVHPFPHIIEVEFAQLDTFSDEAELARIAITTASSIIIDGDNDDFTMSMSLGASLLAGKDTHISAYFHNESKAKLLKSHCPNVECASSRRAEILVRSMQSPGASLVHEKLFSTLEDATLYSLTLDNIPEGISVGDIFQPLRQQHDITLMAVADDEMGDNFKLNPSMDIKLLKGQILHYLAPERIRESEINWGELLN